MSKLRGNPALSSSKKKIVSNRDNSDSVWHTPNVIRVDLDAPITILDLSVRSRNVLSNIGVHSVRELLLTSKEELMDCKNFGRKSLAGVDSKLFAYLSGQSANSLAPDLGTKGSVEKMLEMLRLQHRVILADRYGLWDGIEETLQDIGDKQGLTRERIRQIINSSLGRLRRAFPRELIKNLFSLKFQRFTATDSSRLLAVDEDSVLSALADDCSAVEVGLALGFLGEVAESHTPLAAVLIEVEPGLYCLSPAAAERYNRAVSSIKRAIENAGKPVSAEVICSAITDIPSKDLQEVLRVSPSFGAMPGKSFGLAAWASARGKNLVQLAEIALTHIGRPAHYTEIAKKIREMWHDRRAFSEVGLLARLNYSRDRFVWQANGTYALAVWGIRKPPYIKDRLIDVLSAAKYPMSYSYLERKVLEVCRCKPQSVRMTLDLNPQVFRKFADDQYGLREDYE